MTSRLLNLGRIHAQLAERRIIAHQARRYLSETLKKKQQQFQLDNDTPVYLKGGLGDKMLFQFTLAFCAIGIGNGLYTIYGMAFGKKKH